MSAFCVRVDFLLSYQGTDLGRLSELLRRDGHCVDWVQEVLDGATEGLSVALAAPMCSAGMILARCI